MSAEINWTNRARPAYIVDNQPPLFSYLLAGTMLIFGESEVALHVLMSMISALAMSIFYCLAKRAIPSHALLLTGLFVLSPAFLPGQNLMTDIPMLTAWLVVFWALLGVQAENAIRKYVLAAFAISIACLIKYTSLALVPILFIVLIYRRKWPFLWTLLIPIAILSGWSLWNYLDYGGIHILSRPASPNISSIGSHVIEWIAAIGAAVPFGVLLFIPGNLRRIWRIFLPFLVIVCLAIFVTALQAPTESFPIAVEWTLFVGVGLIIICTLLSQLTVRRRTEQKDHPDNELDLFLVLWLLGAFAFIVLLAPFMAVRYVIVALPPVLLLCGRWSAPFLANRWFALGSLMITACLGFSLAVSDYAYASVYRDYASQIAQTLPSGSGVWTIGHWGWQWYATKAGMREYDRQKTVLKTGEYMVIPSVVAGQILRDDHMKQLRKIKELTVEPTLVTYIRTVGKWPWGGYYAFSWDTKLLPWGFTQQPLEVFSIYIVDH